MVAVSELYYKGQPLDIQRFRQLVIDKGFDPNKPISGNALKKAGLQHPLYLLERQISPGSREKVLEAAGFTTFRSTTYQNDEAKLKQAIIAYNPKKSPINIRKMIRDVAGGGSRLAAALGKFAEKKFGVRTASRALEYFGYRILRPNYKDEALKEKLRKYFPEDAVRDFYQGSGTIPTTGSLKAINPRIYSAVLARGREFVDSLYPEFPDLSSCVFARNRPADPQMLRKQLLQRFHSGLSISGGLRESPEKNERLLYKRIMSLQPQFFGKKIHAKGYSEIVHELLPEMDINNIRGNNTSTISRNGSIGNLFLEWILRWTLRIDNTGEFYKDGFRSFFAAPLEEIHAERRVEKEDTFIKPDFLVVGQKNSAVEVKTGEHISNPTELKGKYSNGAGYSWKIDEIDYPLERLVAVLHMPPKIVRKVAPKLVDASYEVAGAEQFLGWLETFIDKLGESPWHNDLAEAAPRLHNPRTIIDFYKQLAFTPATLTRSTSAEIASFAKDTLDMLVAHEPAA